MAEQTPAPAPSSSAADMAKSVGNGIWAVVAFFYDYTFGMIPVSWRKWCALVTLILLGLWFMRSQLEFKIPTWSPAPCSVAEGQAAPLTSIVPLSVQSQIDDLSHRVSTLESATSVEDPPKAATPPVKTIKTRKAKTIAVK